MTALSRLRSAAAAALKYRAHVVTLGLLAYLCVARSILGGLDARAWLVGASFFLLLGHVYLYNMCCDAVEDAVNLPSQVLSARERPGVLRFAWLLAAAPAPYVATIPRVRAVYAAIVAISLLYSGPRGPRLKRFAATKLLLSAGSYFLVMAAAPALLRGPLGPRDLAALLRAFAPILVSVAAFLLLGDIRDVEGDRAAGHRTFPVLIGAPATAAATAAACAAAAALPGTDPALRLMLAVNAAFAAAALRAPAGVLLDAMILVQDGFLLTVLLAGK